jgi:hypothetical protein
VKAGFDRALKHAQAAKLRFLIEHPWDCPTDVEAEYEKNEDIEWARRDADHVIQEGKSATQVEIPPAEFSPVLVLADLRLPAEVQHAIAERISEHNVVVVKQHGLNTGLMVQIQEHFDSMHNVLLFVDRGVNRVARAKFIASFNALVTGLIPNPRVVAVDSSDTFTAHVWHSRLRLDQGCIAGDDLDKVLKSKDLPENYEAVVMLGKLRLISTTIKHGLRHYSEYEHVDANTPPADGNPVSGEAGNIAPYHALLSPAVSSVNSASQSPRSKTPSESGSKDGSKSRLSMFGTWMNSRAGSKLSLSKDSDPGGRRASKELSQSLDPVIEDDSSEQGFQVGEGRGEEDEEVAEAGDPNLVVADVVDDELITDDGDYISEQENGEFSIPTDFPFCPDWLCMRFIADLNSLFGSLQADLIEDHRYLTILTTHLSHDKLIAAMVSSVLGFWTAPVTKWSDAQINVGCQAFLDHLGTPHALCHMLAVRHLPDCGIFSIRRLEEAISIARTWRNTLKVSFYSHPVRYLLMQWCFTIASMMKRIAFQGGEVTHTFHNTRVHDVRYIDWVGDILSGDTDGVTGDLLAAGLAPYLVYQREDCPVLISYLCNSFDNMEKQVIELRQEYHPVCVYFCGSKVYVSVEMTKLSGHKVRYFASTEMQEVLRMFNPNGIEVFEGRVRKYYIGSTVSSGLSSPGRRDLWYEHLATWCRIDFTHESPKCHLLRARSLLFSRLSTINGYNVRIEAFEERYGEVALVIHNLLSSGASTTLRINREVLSKVSQCCDTQEEKGKLQISDYNAIACIVCDRLQFQPHRSVRTLLQESELLPRNCGNEKSMVVRIRHVGGPGRLVGRQYLKFLGKLHLILSIYELSSSSSASTSSSSSDSDHIGLRVVIYDQESCQTVEYRISWLERLLLFPSDELSIVEQFIQRLKTVYCNVRDNHRTMIRLPPDFVPPRKTFVVDGTTEYELASPFDIYPRSNTGLPEDTVGEFSSTKTSSKSNDDQRIGRGSTKYALADLKNIKLSNKMNTHDPSLVARSAAPSKIAEEADDISEDENGFINHPSSNPLMRAGSGTFFREILEAYTISNGMTEEAYGWVLYFNRTIVDLTRGNLQFSMGINSAQHGFSCFIRDVRSQKETLRFISYKEASNILYNKS